MKKYYIYHIPTFIHKDGRIGKIGCTELEAEERVSQQGYIAFEILEEHDCIYKASDREMELQKQYGYPVDTRPYWKVKMMPTKEGSIKGGKTQGPIQGKINVESGHLNKIRTEENCSKGGKIQGPKNVQSGQLASIRSKENSSKGGKSNKLKTYNCCYCNKTGSFLGMIRWHGERCKHKPTAT